MRTADHLSAEVERLRSDSLKDQQTIADLKQEIRELKDHLRDAQTDIIAYRAAMRKESK
jgi:uncharacterized coiled-coil DUF342 family protein